MRKFLITLAATGAALAVASPAAAQYYPQPQYNGGYNGSYGGYGYHNSGYGQMRGLQLRIDRVQRDIRVLRDRHAISRREYDGLRSESRNLEYRLRNSASYGFNPNEARNIEYRLARLEQHVRHEVSDGNRWGNRGYGYQTGGYGYQNGAYGDRDHDGRDDRYEDDRGRDHDD